MRKKTREIKLIDTGLKVLIQGAGSVPGSLYGPIEGFQEDNKCFLRFYVKTPHHLPLALMEVRYDVRFIAADVVVQGVQFSRYREYGDTYTVLTTMSEGDVTAINFAIEYEKKRNLLLTNRKI
jgi:hypothetical protein